MRVQGEGTRALRDLGTSRFVGAVLLAREPIDVVVDSGWSHRPRDRMGDVA